MHVSTTKHRKEAPRARLPPSGPPTHDFVVTGSHGRNIAPHPPVTLAGGGGARTTRGDRDKPLSHHCILSPSSLNASHPSMTRPTAAPSSRSCLLASSLPLPPQGENIGPSLPPPSFKLSSLCCQITAATGPLSTSRVTLGQQQRQQRHRGAAIDALSLVGWRFIFSS